MVDDMDDDLDAGSENDLDSQPKTAPKGLKGFAAKKGPKLARSKGKQSVTMTNKVAQKKSMTKNVGGK